MSDKSKKVKDYILESVNEELKSLNDSGKGHIAEGATVGAMTFLGNTAAQTAVAGGLAAGSIPAVVTALLPTLAIVGVGAGIGVAIAAGIGVKKYWESNQKGKH